MNPTDREFYPLHDAGNPASTASRRVLDLRPPAPRLRVIEPLPRTPEYHAGYAAGRRSFNGCGIFLAGYLSGVIVSAGGIYFGAMLLAGL